MFTIIENLSRNYRVSVDKVLKDRKVLVRKTHSPEYRRFFDSEVRNLAEVRRSGFTDFVDVESIDHDENTLFFPFINGPDGYAALSKGDEKATLEQIATTMHDEIQSVTSLSNPEFQFLPFLLRNEKDPLFYTRFVLENPQQGINEGELAEMKRLLGVPLNMTFGRYDPEFSNFLLPPGEKALAIDYEYVTQQDALYPFAYAAIHLMKEGYEDAGKNFLHVSEDAMKSFGKHTEDRLVLNIAETCSYLISEYNVQGKTEETEKVSRIFREFL